MVKDICAREEFEKNGETMVSWNQIGKLIETAEGKQYIKLNTNPGILYSVFEKKKKEDRN